MKARVFVPFPLLFALLSGGCAEDFQCAVDYECPGAEVCNQETGACEPFTCDSSDDCPTPTDACEKNRCVSPAK